MRILLVDNHDSYTGNLRQLLWEVSGSRPELVANDEHSAEDLLARDWTHLVISPGPGRPDRPADFGCCTGLIAGTPVPLLGVCLGHQGIAAVLGGRVEEAPVVMHGRLSRIRHTGTGVFAGLPQDFAAVRYHSLRAALPASGVLVPTAWAEDGVLMGLAHRTRPLHGVQFHPESVQSEHGARLLATFLGLDRPRAYTAGFTPPDRPQRTVSWRALGQVDAERVFLGLHAGDPGAFWLDSAAQAYGMGGVSYLGSGGPVLRAYAGTGVVEEHAGGRVRRHPGTILDLLRSRTGGPAPAGCPVPFAGGWVGYLGYGIKADLGLGKPGTGERPDAELRRVDRFVAVDHATGQGWAVLAGDDTGWLDRTEAAVRALPAVPPPPPPAPATVESTVDRRAYGEHFAEIQRWLRRGDSYEACYTYQLAVRGAADPLGTYRRLRRLNPAPYGAYLRSGDRHVLCSSPERFVRVGADGWAETKPIKGTAAGHTDPSSLRADEKNRAENLMIVDLLRNDLGRVCLPGTVRVPELMAVESYRGLHHLVTTVRGRLEPGRTGVDCVAALFPGGSMTGAPKRRTVELLDGLEAAPRGVYAGCLGWIGADGTADLAIVIRTLAWDGDTVTLGVGGAVTALSDVDDEWAETLVKAAAPLAALGVAPPR